MCSAHTRVYVDKMCIHRDWMSDHIWYITCSLLQLLRTWVFLRSKPSNIVYLYELYIRVCVHACVCVYVSAHACVSVCVCITLRVYACACAHEYLCVFNMCSLTCNQITDVHVLWQPYFVIQYFPENYLGNSFNAITLFINHYNVTRGFWA